jgi:hypothetical protein
MYQKIKINKYWEQMLKSKDIELHIKKRDSGPVAALNGLNIHNFKELVLS